MLSEQKLYKLSKISCFFFVNSGHISHGNCSIPFFEKKGRYKNKIFTQKCQPTSAKIAKLKSPTEMEHSFHVSQTTASKKRSF